MQQWTSLNDVFDRGDIEVWYMNSGFFRDGIMGDSPNPSRLQDTHVLLGSVALSPCPKYSEDELEELYRKLQGEFWSPNGEARKLIKSLGLRHTSMSVGDCFRLPNREVWLVAPIGMICLDEDWPNFFLDRS